MTTGLRLRTLLTTAAAGAAITALLAGSAALAGPLPAPYLELALTDPCVSGFQFTPNASITLTLKRSGSVVARTTFKSTGERILRCLAVAPRGGDKLTIKQVKNNATLTNRTLELPRLTVTLSAATDTLSVHGERGGVPMDGEQVLQGPSRTIGGRSLIGGLNTISLDTNGDASQDWSSVFDITHGSFGFASWAGPQSDLVAVYTGLPMVAVRSGKAVVSGVARPGTTTTITLKTAGGTQRGRLTATGALDEGDPLFGGSFRNGTAKVKAAVGNKVTSSRLTGSWTVLPNTLAVTAGEGSGSASVTCPAGVEAAVWLDGGQAGANSFPGGAVSFTDLFIVAGTKVEVACQDTNGFAQWFTTTVVP